MAKTIAILIELEKVSSSLGQGIHAIGVATADLCSQQDAPASSLLVVVSCPEIAKNLDHPVELFDPLQRLLCNLYGAASSVALELGNPLLPVDVVLSDWCGYDPWLLEDIEALAGFPEDKANLATINVKRAKDNLPHLRMHSLSEVDARPEVQPIPTPEVERSSTHKIYDHVAMGGTFDHLHGGHKILLTMAAWLTRQRLICGVTDLNEEQVKKKAFGELIQPSEWRVKAVKEFLNKMRFGLVYDVVLIQDDFGPTKDDPKIQAIVGSQETAKGCAAGMLREGVGSLPHFADPFGLLVNALREKVGLSILDIFLIDLIAPRLQEGTTAVKAAEKMSSTLIRKFLASRKKE
ncbi:hypothetical protein DFS34DRAFT_659117 [Phlyctochytrium arcticum]|nr:hypothetical protein DFS34DRAFT_659117 [Phlyctochytrium arcticum]